MIQGGFCPWKHDGQDAFQPPPSHIRREKPSPLQEEEGICLQFGKQGWRRDGAQYSSQGESGPMLLGVLDNLWDLRSLQRPPEIFETAPKGSPAWEALGWVTPQGPEQHISSHLPPALQPPHFRAFQTFGTSQGLSSSTFLRELRDPLTFPAAPTLEIHSLGPFLGGK